jgi:hypothetical protein
LQGVGHVTAEWRRAHLLCPAFAVSEQEFCNLDTEVELRNAFEHEFAGATGRARYGLELV